ncbi:transcription repressor NadR [Bacillaceae bacterium]
MVLKKLSGEERRGQVLAWLKASGEPVTGADLAKRANVSRQVIVQDIALLKARNEPIVATPQGYFYLHAETEPKVKRVIACRHGEERMEEELNILVDHGVKVVDVIVDHPVYGEIRGSLMLASREDVRQFIKNMRQTDAPLLSALTDGVHLHTLEAPAETNLRKACAALEKAGILLSRS